MTESERRFRKNSLKKMVRTELQWSVQKGGKYLMGASGTKTGATGRGITTTGYPALITSLWDILNADDTTIASQSPGKLGMMVVIVTISVSEANTEVMCF